MSDYLESWVVGVKSAAVASLSASSPVAGVATFAERGVAHSAHGLLLELVSGARVAVQVCVVGPQPDAPAVGERSPAAPTWSALCPDGLVNTAWVEEWVAHVVGAARPDARVARYSVHPELGGRVQAVGVQALEGGHMRVLCQFAWMLRAGEAPGRYNRFRYRPQL